MAPVYKNNNHISYIALGGNIDDVPNTFKEAAAMLEALGHEIVAKSALYRSLPWGGVAQPPFYNAVIEIKHTNSPRALLTEMQQIEIALGRPQKHELNGPRTIDLDLLVTDTIIINSKSLTLPHPRMSGRPFVMVPLAELAPELILPGFARKVGEIAAALLTSLGEGSIIEKIG